MWVMEKKRMEVSTTLGIQGKATKIIRERESREDAKRVRKG